MNCRERKEEGRKEGRKGGRKKGNLCQLKSSEAVLVHKLLPPVWLCSEMQELRPASPPALCHVDTRGGGTRDLLLLVYLHFLPVPAVTLAIDSHSQLCPLPRTRPTVDPLPTDWHQILGPPVKAPDVSAPPDSTPSKRSPFLASQSSENCLTKPLC